jgi:hypothetical protein
MKRNRSPEEDGLPWMGGCIWLNQSLHSITWSASESKASTDPKDRGTGFGSPRIHSSTTDSIPSAVQSVDLGHRPAKPEHHPRPFRIGRWPSHCACTTASIPLRVALDPPMRCWPRHLPNCTRCGRKAGTWGPINALEPHRPEVNPRLPHDSPTQSRHSMPACSPIASRH